MKRHKGFTLVELIIVIAIIAILAALAVPAMIQYRMRGYNSSARVDIKNAFTSAQAYLGEAPGGTVTPTILADYGYIATQHVTVSVNDGTLANLEITSAHSAGDTTYTINADGYISP